MEDYKLRINKKELLEILSNYYSKRLGKVVKVQEKHSIEYFGYYESKSAKVILYYDNEVNIMGHKVKGINYISEEELKMVLGELLQDYAITDIHFNRGITTEGYYTYEHEVAYFDGIDISLKEKQITSTLNHIYLKSDINKMIKRK